MHRVPPGTPPGDGEQPEGDARDRSVHHPEVPAASAKSRRRTASTGTDHAHRHATCRRGRRAGGPAGRVAVGRVAVQDHLVRAGRPAALGAHRCVGRRRSAGRSGRTRTGRTRRTGAARRPRRATPMATGRRPASSRARFAATTCSRSVCHRKSITRLGMPIVNHRPARLPPTTCPPVPSPASRPPASLLIGHRRPDRRLPRPQARHGRRPPAGQLRHQRAPRHQPRRGRSPRPTSWPSRRRSPSTRHSKGYDGPLYMGRDTHALSPPAQQTALEVLAGNGVETVIASGDTATPTPVVSLVDPDLQQRPQDRAGRRDRQSRPATTRRPTAGSSTNPPNGGPADNRRHQLGAGPGQPPS